MDDSEKLLKKIALSREDFYKRKLQIKQEKHTKWSEDFTKKVLIGLGINYILNVDGNSKIQLNEKIKTPDFIIGTKPNKIKFLTNKNCYFYIDVKEVTGAMYSNFKNPDNPVKKMLEKLQNSNLGEKQTLIISEFDDEIINKLIGQIYKIEDNYGKLRKCGKTGIIYVESKVYNNATNFHFLKLTEIILTKIINIFSHPTLYDLRNKILSTQKNELIILTFLSFIVLFGTHVFDGLKLFFIDSNNYEKFKSHKDFKWLVKLVKKQNQKFQKGLI